jgi:hypothetical protein
MTRLHTSLDALFDDPMAEDLLDNDETACYGSDVTFCDYGMGDCDGLCVRPLHSCWYVGCEASSN